MPAIRTEEDFAKLADFYEYLLSKVPQKEIPVHYRHKDTVTGYSWMYFDLPGIKEVFLRRVIMVEAHKFFKKIDVQVAFGKLPQDVYGVKILVSANFVHEFFSTQPIARVAKMCGPVIWDAFLLSLSYDAVMEMGSRYA